MDPSYAGTSPVVLVEKRDGMAIVTLNRPDAANALSKALVKALDETFVTLAGDPGLRAVVLTGAGEKAFCAGADLKERRAMTPAPKHSRHKNKK